MQVQSATITASYNNAADTYSITTPPAPNNVAGTYYARFYSTVGLYETVSGYTPGYPTPPATLPGPWGVLPFFVSPNSPSGYLTRDGFTQVNPMVIYTSPRKRVEGGPSYGIYRKWLTTFKIDPTQWLENGPSNGGKTFPGMGDKITYTDGTVWTVFKDVDSPSNLLGISGLWRLPCVYLEIYTGFSDNVQSTIQYLQSSCSGSSATGSRTMTFTAVGSPVNGVVQPFNAELGVMFGTKDFEDHYLIYLSSDPSGTGTTVINAGDLFQDQNGVKYEIIESLNRNLLDELPTFHCVKKL